MKKELSNGGQEKKNGPAVHELEAFLIRNTQKMNNKLRKKTNHIAKIKEKEWGHV